MPQFPSQQSASGIWTLKKQKRAQQGSNWPLRTLGDFLWNYVTALFKTNSTNGAQNNTFLDSSTNAFSITRNGNATQGTFTPYGANWSNLAVPNGSNEITTNYPGLSGTGNYTVSFWVYLNSWAGGDNNGSDGGFVYIYGQGASHPTYPFAIRITKAGKVVIVDSVNFGPTWESTFDYAGSYNTANSIGLGRWHYIHIVRNSGTLSIYANGKLQLSVAQSSAMAAPYTNGIINDINGFDGYISNFRIATTAITDPTPPTGPTSASGAVLLTCASNRFQDLTGNYTVTRSGSVSVQRFSPFGPTVAYSAATIGGSGYFDGNGDTLTTSGGNVSGTGAFTVEFWIYPIATGSQQLIYGDANTGSLYIYFFGDNLLHVSNYNIANQFVSIPTTRNSWNHVVVVRDSSGNYSVFMNGARAGTLTGNTTNYASMSTVRVGGEASQRFIGGYMSDVRVSTNAALYNPTQTTITVPTAPLTAITNTSLLLNFTNGGIFDGAVMNNFETVGNAQVSTAQAIYGTTSMSFDGSGDYLALANVSNTNLGGGPFTIECWVRFNSVSGTQFILSNYQDTTNGYGLGLSSGAVAFWATGDTPDINSGFTPVTGVWYHLAVSGQSGSIKLFINGKQYGSTFTGAPALNSTATLRIGDGQGAASPQAFNGFIDDLRITKGYARYWYPFTPPTAELPDFYEPEVIPANDPLFDYTTLLLSGNGTNGAQNNTFLDSSTNAFTITRNGNTTQGTFTPYGSNWSNYFDGSGDYLSVPGSSAFAYGTGSFTIEFWIFSQIANDRMIYDARNTGSTGPQHFTTGGYGGSRVGALRYVGSSEIISTAIISDNNWHHCAIVRNGSSAITLFVDGIPCGSGTDTTNYVWTSGNNLIGINSYGAGSEFNGYLSNFRIVKGTALYTSAFTPSTTPLTAIANTSLLTCADNRFIDDSTNNFTITRTGNVSIQRFSPFNPTSAYSVATVGGSAYFDGSGDFLTVATNAAFSFGTGDFTISTWIYTGNDSLSPAGYSRSIFTIGNITGYLRISAYHGGTTGAFRAYVGASTICDGSTVKLSDNAWHHIAIVRESGTVRHWIDGVYVGAVAYSTNMSNTITNGLGADMNGPDANWNGYIGPTLVVKGTALYTGTSNITVPTAPPTVVAGTSLLTSMTNGGIIDNAMMNDLETVGNAQISTSVSKFGGGSISFDGSGDYLLIPNSENFNFGAGDWTIEFWVRFNSVGTRQIIMSPGNSSGTNAPFYFELNSSLRLRFLIQTASTGQIFVDTTYTPNANQWYHLAGVRNGSTATFYVDGTPVGSVTPGTNALTAITNQLVIGDYIGLGFPLNGYLDDVRFTKGIARYVQPFTPPTQAFQTQ